MLKFKFSKNVLKMMQARGLDNSVLQGSKISFELEESIIGFKPDMGEDVVTKKININKQISTVERLLDNPFYGHSVTCINSYPTDLRAKCVAANIMEAAMFDHLERKQKRRHSKQPYWVRLYSDTSFGYIEKIKEQKPGLLIISNITSSSTAQRIEKLRDILEYFDDIPRIVVQTGDYDPIRFFSHKLFMALDNAVLIGPANRVKANTLLEDI